MTSSLQWFRLYHRVIDDEKIRLLAFEDRWHFIAVCCLKADGLLDEPDGPLKDRKIAVKMGVQARELDEIRRRLFEVGLTDENMHPAAWNDLQFRSDNSTERVRKFREKSTTKQVKRSRNVSVTRQETDTETDTEGKKEPNGSTKKATRIPVEWRPDEVFASREGMSPSEIAREASRFRDYWQAQPGQRGVKADWPATWRNWVRKFTEGRSGASSSSPDPVWRGVDCAPMTEAQRADALSRGLS